MKNKKVIPTVNAKTIETVRKQVVAIQKKANTEIKAIKKDAEKKIEQLKKQGEVKKRGTK